MGGAWACPVLRVAAAILLAGLAEVCPFPAAADVAPNVLASAPAGEAPEKLLINANELIYDKDTNTISAVGDVELYYKHRILQADRVIYRRAERRVFAEGHVKLTDERGDVIYATRFELTDDFRDGFIDTAQVLSTDRTRFSAPRVERVGGVYTTFEQGAYTACEPCREHPERPPLWQVRALKIIENQQTHIVYYENAWLELAGVPVAYVPYFSAPDSTVTRQSGLLAPRLYQGQRLGYGLGIPYFFDLAPNYDLTLTPSLLSKQGFFGEAIWRHRLEYGEYSVRVTGVDEQRPDLYLPAPYGAGSNRVRGSLETSGLFYLSPNWKFGWDATFLSDRFYLEDFKIKGVDFSSTYYQDVVSSIYLRGQGERSFFDLSAYTFQGTSASDEQRELPIALPVLDYDKTFSIPPETTAGLGGELTIDLNATNVTRLEAAFQSTGTQTFDQAYGLYNVCETNGQPTYVPGRCLLRGMAGDYARATAQASWTRKYVDPLGEEWTPFVFARADGEAVDLNMSGGYTYSSAAGTSTVLNSSQANFFNGASSDSAARGMPGVGLEYRFPFVSYSSFGTQVIQPIAQFIVRPNESIPKVQPNEDAQSLVFDETTLFAWDKYSGYDRVEGGTRFNYGGQYTADFSDGGHASLIAGQSIQVAGQNSYTIPDAANTGLESGLDKKYSNYVAGETLAPFSSSLTFESKQQFDSSNFSLTRFDGIVNAKFDRFWTSFDYGRYGAQPLLGWPNPREGFVWSTGLKLTDNWSVDGSLFVDMSRHFYDTAGQTTPRFYPVNYSFGFGYADTCTTFKLHYSNAYTSPIGAPTTTPPSTRDQTVLLELDLRTLGGLTGSFDVQ